MYYRTSKLFLFFTLCVVASGGCAGSQKSENLSSANSGNVVKTDSESFQNKSDSENITNQTTESVNIETSVESAQQLKVLYDFREIDEFRPQPKFGRVEERLVLEFTYGKIKKEFSRMDSLLQRLDGSFTDSNLKQTLYLTSGGDNPHRLVAIYEGTKPLYKIRFEGEEIIKIIDLDNDGRNELLIISGDVYMYGRDLDLQIARVNQKGIEILKTFKGILSSSDSEEHKSTLAEVAVISYKPAAESRVFPTE